MNNKKTNQVKDNKIKKNEVKQNMNKKQFKKENKKNTIITILILLFISISAFVGIKKQIFINSEKVGYVSLEPVNVTLNSGDGEHKVSIKVTLGGKNKQLNKLNMEKVQQVAKETISNLDYNSIVEKEGSQYVKNTILKNLKASFGDSIQSLILDDILTDLTLFNSNNTQNNSNIKKREEYLKGLSWTNKK